MYQWALCFFPSRSSGPSGPSRSRSHPTWRPAGLQRCLGGVLPPAGRLLRHSQPSTDGCSTTSPSGTPLLRICPPHPLNTQLFCAITRLHSSGFTGFQWLKQLYTLNQNCFLPIQDFNFLILGS